MKKIFLFLLVLLGAIFMLQFLLSGSKNTAQEMSQDEAFQLAQSKCLEGYAKSQDAFYNPNSKTWWFEFTPNEPKQGCNPACVVNVETKQTEINWRCTGLIPE